MARQSHTRERIIDRARHLLQRRGFDGFSYADIAGHLGVKNAAIHYHFPAKTDLGLAMLEDFTADVKRQIECAAASNVPVKVQLDHYFDQVNHEFCDNDWAICPLGAFSTTFDRLTPEMQQATRRISQILHVWMKEILAQGRADGEFRFAGSPEDKATEISCAIQGARQVSRVVGRNLVSTVADQIRRDLYQ